MQYKQISVIKVLKTISVFVKLVASCVLFLLLSSESTAGKPLIPAEDTMPGYKLCTGSRAHIVGGDLQHLYQVSFSELTSFLYLQWKSQDFAFACYKSHRQVRVPN